MVLPWSIIRVGLMLFIAFSVLSGCGVPIETAEIGASPDAANDSSDAANKAPTISGVPPQMAKVGVSYSFTPTASDPDSDPLTFSISNQPDWASFDSDNGELSGIAPPGSVGTYNDVVISVSDGEQSVALPAFSITVEPTTTVNMPPEISGTPKTSATVGRTYSFIPTASDPDGDLLTFGIVGKPDWATFDPNSGEISGTPRGSDEGRYENIGITVSDGRESASLPAFDITVSTTNGPPTIGGIPPTSVIAGDEYFFRPSAADPNGDSLTFSIENRPAWASFRRSDGRLRGIPAETDVGRYDNVKITVTDGQLSVSLPAFDIAVAAISPTNRAPTISGSPSGNINVGDSYLFKPTASDPDGDSLTFSIMNKPAWASFDSSTGRLAGTPSQGDEGTFSNIRISVTDGQLSVSLAQFSIDVSPVALGSVTLSWTPPTRNTDGSVLTDLAAYKIYYGLSEGVYSNEIRIDSPGIASYVIENLVPDTYYFVATTINQSGVESDYSNVATKTVN